VSAGQTAGARLYVKPLTPAHRAMPQGDTMSNFADHPLVKAEVAGVVQGRFRRRPADADENDDREALDRVVERAQLGDRDALAYLYLRYAGNVYGFVAGIVRDEHEAEDITQQVFAGLVVMLVKYERRESPFVAWLLAVARNVALAHLRRQRPIPCDQVYGADLACPAADPLDAVSIRDALADLPRDQRQVVVMRHVVGLTPGEIAGRLGRTESSINSLHHRGRGTMRASLRRLGATPAVMAS
jgi:RNA polymerase sigma-70 factor (ECF subfamily)